MLDDRIKSRILEDHKKLTAAGKLLSKPQLDGYYRTFRGRFGPEVLAKLDGLDLLETMHALGTKDSLVYWLEFKNDDEFPARFGSIAGGNALKFGIFRRKETGTWVTADERNNAKDITVEEAVAIARKHRDQLVRGVDHLSLTPPNGTDDDYKRLQEHLDKDAPDVSNLAWGHKYFSLLAPEKLDDYHVPGFQRFYLIKMLQVPPGGGRALLVRRAVCCRRSRTWHTNQPPDDDPGPPDT